MQKTFTTKSDTETIALGSKLGAMLCGGEFIALTGDLGGGKTQFTKGIAKALGITETVVSPTFTIERVYGKMHHFDLYRISDDKEIAAEIIELASDGKSIIVVEWPENISGILPKDFLSINFMYISENVRKLSFSSCHPEWKRRIQDLHSSHGSE
jgi:tRNA threonylcarbamoyladenosine biosynthesis protein TsaE